jgi:hypothetical protein
MGSQIGIFRRLRSVDFGITKINPQRSSYLDFGNTEIKIAAEYFDFMAHCSDTLCTIRSIVQTGGFNLENRRE